MKSIVPLNQPPNHGEWKKLLAVLRDEHLARQTTVIMNPAGGPGPDKPWPERREWLALMAEIKATGARLAWYLRVRDAEVNGEPKAGRWNFTRRSVAAIKQDIHLWRTKYQEPLGYDDAAWWFDRHPASMDSLQWPEVKAIYEVLAGERHTVANVACIPPAEFVRALPARGLCVHARNGWPPGTAPTLAGKPTAIIATGIGILPGAGRAASWLYVTDETNPAGVFTRISDHLPRILTLNAA